MSELSGFQVSGDAAKLREQYSVRYFIGPWTPGLVALAALQPGERVLDVACGTGLVARLAAPEVGPTGQVTGVDINTAMLAVEAIKRGDIGIAGSTGAILDRSLKGLQDLTARALVDVRLTAGIPERRKRVLVAEFIEETRVSAAIDAAARGLELIVPDVEPGLAIEVDSQILAGAVANLLQNAFKFTRSQSGVSLRTSSSDDRVLIEVEDECGGLPTEDAEDLFRLFEQQSRDRTGLGLGLSISRRGVEANGGKLHVRNLPGRGCVFTIDLPKAA